MTTTSRPPAIRNADAFNKPRRSMSGLSPAGTQVAQGCAPALQKRSDNNGCAARLSPQTLLFATQSLARLYSIADDSRENACRLHPFAKATAEMWVDHGCPWQEDEYLATASIAVTEEVAWSLVPSAGLSEPAGQSIPRLDAGWSPATEAGVGHAAG